MISRNNSIQESFFIRDIKNLMGPNSWLAIDLDNTVFEPLTITLECNETLTTSLGSDQWFVKLMQYAGELILDHEEAVITVLAIYFEVHHHIKMRAVEADIVDIIKEYQNKGHQVIALTARSECLRDVTIRQLQEIGIDFKGKIIFCDGQDKGVCFKAFLEKADQLPPDVVMADDKGKHLEHVRDVLISLGINFAGLRYGFLDEKVKNFDMEPAQIQLIQMQHKLSESANKSIDKLKITSSIGTHSMFKNNGNNKQGNNNENALFDTSSKNRLNY